MPACPKNDGSLSTTRVTLPKTLPPNATPVDVTNVVPEHPHWPLVVMTVLTQLAVGAFTTIWLSQVFGAAAHLGTAALASLIVGGLALSASTLHLGRPIHAYRAIRMWRRSWLSREVLLFSAFSRHRGRVRRGVVVRSAGRRIHRRVDSRRRHRGRDVERLHLPRAVTPGVEHASTRCCSSTSRPRVLGPLFAAVVGGGNLRWLAIGAATMASAQFVLLALRLFRCISSDSLELRGTARLLSTVLAGRLVLRGVLLALGAVALPLLAAGPQLLTPNAPTGSMAGAAVMVAALALATTAEIVGRYLFFVSVVPKHLAAPYIASASEAS